MAVSRKNAWVATGLTALLAACSSSGDQAAKTLTTDIEDEASPPTAQAGTTTTVGDGIQITVNGEKYENPDTASDCYGEIEVAAQVIVDAQLELDRTALHRPDQVDPTALKRHQDAQEKANKIVDGATQSVGRGCWANHPDLSSGVRFYVVADRNSQVTAVDARAVRSS